VPGRKRYSYRWRGFFVPGRDDEHIARKELAKRLAPGSEASRPASVGTEPVARPRLRHEGQQIGRPSRCVVPWLRLCLDASYLEKSEAPVHGPSRIALYNERSKKRTHDAGAAIADLA